MKYKVTITSADHTGHEDEPTILQNQTKFEIGEILNQMPNSKFSIEPQPEKQKVTVWFYVVKYKNGLINSRTHTDLNEISGYRNANLSDGDKVSEIKSMEVDI
jgi:hypothetical protein